MAKITKPRPKKSKLEQQLDDANLSPLVSAAFKALIFTTIIGKLSESLCETISSIIVGQAVGGSQLAALSLIRPLNTARTAVCYLIATGAISLCAYYMGDNRRDRVNSVFSLGCIASVISGGVFTVAFLLFAENIAAAFGATGELLANSAAYMRGMCWGFIPFFLARVTVDAVTVDGSKDLAVASTVAMGVAAIGVDLISLFVFNLGVFGVGLAFTASSVASLVVTLIHFTREHNTLRLVRPTKIRYEFIQICRRGSTTCLVRVAAFVQGIARNAVLLSFGGAPALAASGAMLSVRGLVRSTVISCNSIVGSMVSAFSGERDREAMSNAIKTAFKVESVLGGIWIVVLVMFPSWVCYLFGVTDADALQTGVAAMRFYAVSILAEVARQLILSVQSAMNRPMVSIVGSLGANVFLYVPMVMLLPQFMGINGAWLAIPACEFVTLAGCIIYLKVKGADIIDPGTWALLPEDWNSDEILFSVDGAKPGDPATEEQIVTFCEKNGIERGRVLNALSCAEEVATLIANSRCVKEPRGIVERLARSSNMDMRTLTTVEYRLVHVSENDSLVLRMRYAGSLYNPFDEKHDDQSFEIKLIEAKSESRDYRYTLDLNNLALEVKE